VDEPRRTYAGPTGTKHQCAHCGSWSKLERDVDERPVVREQVEGGGVLISERVTPT
jgi:hypothetical protein